jgi:hypothetical protein
MARVIRVIEYLVNPGSERAFRDVLRRSLVGTEDFEWGSITAAVVDSVDSRQEDLLRLAKLQPGVWLGGPKIDGPGMAEVFERMLQRPPKPGAGVVPPPGMDVRPLSVQGAERVQELADRTVEELPPPAAEEPPDVGRTPPAEMIGIAREWAQEFGYRFIHTISLALSAIAEELRANSEPNKFLTAEQCLDFAQALMNEIPDEWDGDEPQDIQEPN